MLVFFGFLTHDDQLFSIVLITSFIVHLFKFMKSIPVFMLCPIKIKNYRIQSSLFIINNHNRKICFWKYTYHPLIMTRIVYRWMINLVHLNSVRYLCRTRTHPSVTCLSNSQLNTCFNSCYDKKGIGEKALFLLFIGILLKLIFTSNQTRICKQLIVELQSSVSRFMIITPLTSKGYSNYM